MTGSLHDRSNAFERVCMTLSLPGRHLQLAVTRKWLHDLHPADYAWALLAIGSDIGLLKVTAGGLSEVCRDLSLDAALHSNKDDDHIFICNIQLQRKFVAESAMAEIFTHIMGPEWRACPPLFGKR